MKRSSVAVLALSVLTCVAAFLAGPAEAYWACCRTAYVNQLVPVYWVDPWGNPMRDGYGNLIILRYETKVVARPEQYWVPDGPLFGALPFFFGVVPHRHREWRGPDHHRGDERHGGRERRR
ncbi:MAG: hypothetical protein HYT39_01830 [Candidatus Sungbacteria bacterium]|nr:hypothetical protein [Candidatus Sungbacteria bacterium]